MTDCTCRSYESARRLPESAALPRWGVMMNNGPLARRGWPETSAAPGTTSRRVSGATSS